VLYVFYGPDRFRAREELSRLRRQLDKDGNLSHNTVRIDAPDVRGLKPADLRATCNTASFFAEDRLVIVEGLLARLGGTRRRRGSSGRTRARSDSPASEAEEFVDVLANLPETTTVVLLDESVSEGLKTEMEALGTVRNFGVLRGDQLRGWAAERVRAQGGTFAAGALDRLVSLVDGAHLGELASEIDKLITYANGRPVQARDVDDLVSGAVQYQTWDLTDAVIEGRADRALGVLQRMDTKSQPPQLLSFMLVRQYRQLMLAQAYQRDGMSTAQIGSQLGLRDFPLKKIVDQAGRYGSDRLDAAYRRLLEHDVAVKTGVMDADASFEALIVSLAELGRSMPRRAGAGRR
jgi:DNA polymerase III subunit delta